MPLAAASFLQAGHSCHLLAMLTELYMFTDCASLLHKHHLAGLVTHSVAPCCAGEFTIKQGWDAGLNNQEELRAARDAMNRRAAAQDRNKCLCGNRGMLLCSKCREQSYCCRLCQEKDWPAHKRACKEVCRAKAAAGADAAPADESVS